MDIHEKLPYYMDGNSKETIGKAKKFVNF